MELQCHNQLWLICIESHNNSNIISVSNFFIDNENISHESLIKAKNFKNLIYAGNNFK